MNQTYFEWYEFDVEDVPILIATPVLINQPCIVSLNESDFNIVDSLYIQNFMSGYVWVANHQYHLFILFFFFVYKSIKKSSGKSHFTWWNLRIQSNIIHRE